MNFYTYRFIGTVHNIVDGKNRDEVKRWGEGTGKEEASELETRLETSVVFQLAGITPEDGPRVYGVKAYTLLMKYTVHTFFEAESLDVARNLAESYRKKLVDEIEDVTMIHTDVTMSLCE